MYKVVSYLDGRYWSYIASASLRVEYKPNEWVEAKIGGLLVFDTLDQARWFSGGDILSTAIWECDVEDEVPLPPVAMNPNMFKDPNSNLRNKVIKVWRGDRLPEHSCTTWPQGTKAFRRVKITRYVPPR